MPPFSGLKGNSVLRITSPGAIAGRTLGSIDYVDYIDGLPGLIHHERPTILPVGAPLLVSGWGIDPVTRGRPRAVSALLDRVRPYDGLTGLSRNDVVAAQISTEEFTGFRLVVPTEDLPVGHHEVHIYALSADGAWYELGATGFWLFRHDSALPEGGSVPHTLQMYVEDPIDFETGRPIPKGTPFHANATIVLRGNTYDPVAQHGADTMVVRDAAGRTWCGAGYAKRGSLGLRTTHRGFEIFVPARVLGVGRHQLALYGRDASGRRYPNDVSVAVDITAARQRFPLTARIAHSIPPFAARLRIFGQEVRDIPLPAHDKIVVPPGAFSVDGWALDESGNAAHEVFIERSAPRPGLPALRHPADAGRRIAIDGIAPAPIAGTCFSGPFEVPAGESGESSLALDIVQPGRRSYSRIHLAMLQIIS